MRIPRIFTHSAMQIGQLVALDEAAANHVARVLRMQITQPLVLFNGDGSDYSVTLQKVDKREVIVRVDDCQEKATESPLAIRLAQVMSRGDRMDYVIQKSVEMGVSEILPLTSERCEVKLKGEREDKRLAHWQQVAISAAEQSGRARLPVIHAPQQLDDWLQQAGLQQPERQQADGPDLKLVLHHRTSAQLNQLAAPRRLTLLIGPEGGLSRREIALAEQQGFLATALGPRVMRTETAPVAALAICQWLWGDLAG